MAVRRWCQLGATYARQNFDCAKGIAPRARHGRELFLFNAAPSGLAWRRCHLGYAFERRLFIAIASDIAIASGSGRAST
jgi:hypothetical protein